MASKTHIWHNLSPEKIAGILRTDLDNGLSEKEVKERQRQGRNVLPQEKPLSRLRILFRQLKSPLIYILLIAGAMTLGLGHWTDAIVIFAAVLINTSVGYIQELKASNSLSELKKILKVKADTIRDGREKEILQEDLAPGDIIILKAGSKAPADARIIKTWNLKMQESALTGEWLAAEKTSEILPDDTPLADRDNMVYMGTIVADGEAKAVVVGTGVKTELGKVAKLIKGTKESKTPYQKKLTKFSRILTIIIAVICIAIFTEGIIKGRGFVEMFITSTAIAVAAIPEGLPVAMTVILALGMQRILRRKGLVRKLASAETLGSTSVIATDKTLTLTEGKMEAAEIKAGDMGLALKICALTNEAFIENPDSAINNWQVRGRPTDKAMLLAAAERGIKKPELEKEYKKIDEIIFTPKNKFVAVLRKHKTGAFLFVAGAPEKLIDLTVKYKDKAKHTRATVRTIIRLTAEVEELTSRGLRVIAVAYKKIPPKTEIKNLKDEVRDLIFVGLIGFHDPIRKEAKNAFALCRKAGMRPIIVTGDHLLTAKAVAKELCLKTNKENIMLGEELDKLSDVELSKQLNKIDVFARVEPRHKLRIISAWQDKNEVVAMTGDGINDAPALKKADIGVALGSGTDVAKEVSDLVLLNDNFSILVAAVEEGREILDNIRKVITYLLSDSFTEMLLISVSLLFGMPLPILAAQILWVNLIEDGFPSIALAFEPKERDLMSQKPGGHSMPLLTKEMKVIIFAIGLFTDLLLLGLMFYLYNKLGAAAMPYIRTMIFAGLTIDSIFYVFSCKSLRKNIWHINIFSNKYLIGAWLFGFIALLSAVYLPFLQNLLKTVPLAPTDWLILSTLGACNLIAIEVTKHYFIARHQTNT